MEICKNIKDREKVLWQILLKNINKMFARKKEINNVVWMEENLYFDERS